MLDRRQFLSGRGAGAAGAGAGAMAAEPADALAREPKEMPEQAVGILCDSTLRIGCQACVDACRAANDVTIEEPTFNLDAWNPARTWDTTLELDGETLNVIKLWRDGTGATKDAPEDGYAFVKRHCLHCVDASCVSVCPVSAMTKYPETGIVGYNKDACIGCRYCSYACPFGVRQFDLSEPFGRINKCEMCRHLQARGEIPACCDVCPTGASLFGPVDILRQETERRLAAKPGTAMVVPRGSITDSRPDHERITPTYQNHVYGTTEVGGTQVLYLSAVPFENLGLPKLGSFAPVRLAEGLQHTIYKWFLAPILAVAGVAFLVRRNRPRREAEQGGDA